MAENKRPRARKVPIEDRPSFKERYPNGPSYPRAGRCEQIAWRPVGMSYNVSCTREKDHPGLHVEFYNYTKGGPLPRTYWVPGQDVEPEPARPKADYRW